MLMMKHSYIGSQGLQMEMVHLDFIKIKMAVGILLLKLANRV
jgi:hypothetical protein